MDKVQGVGTPRQDGSVETIQVWVFPVSPRVVDGDGADVVPFPLDRMPDFLKSELTSTTLAAIVAGDAGWVRVSVEKSPGESDGDFQARMDAAFAVEVPWRISQARDKAVEEGDYNRFRFGWDT